MRKQHTMLTIINEEATHYANNNERSSSTLLTIIKGVKTLH